jgi:(E)-4-hydroxy-3-methylbut-2-enyl-diphosphate synthase
MACDYIFLGDKVADFPIPGTLGLIYDHATWRTQKLRDRVYPLVDSNIYLHNVERSSSLNFVRTSPENCTPEFIDAIQKDKTVVLVITTNNEHGMAEQRRLFVELIQAGCDVSVIIQRSYADLSQEEFQLYSATDVGGLFIDGLGDGVFLSAVNCGADKMINETAFNILQATRTRISKTEYISCPSCGRTLFDLQETTNKIRVRTNHLKGLKIGIMGCIVNGPGEMADADYGYVGSGPDRITLYKGKEVVRRNIPAAKAVDELIELIREHGDWVEQA